MKDFTEHLKEELLNLKKFNDLKDIQKAFVIMGNLLFVKQDSLIKGMRANAFLKDLINVINRKTDRLMIACDVIQMLYEKEWIVLD